MYHLAYYPFLNYDYIFNMSFISNRMSKIKPSITLALSAKAKELSKSPGKKLISLGLGEPDFQPPSHVKDAVIKAINDGMCKYGAASGIDKIKNAVVNKFRDEYNFDIDNSCVLATSGAKQAIFNVFMASLNEEDEVIILSPYWVSYPEMIKLAGGTPVVVNTDFCDIKASYRSIKNAITSKTKWIIINSPNNPSGVVYNTEELSVLIDLVKEYNHIGVISDEIYEYMSYDQKYISMVSIIPKEYEERFVIVNGLSKSHAVMGWRIGYSVSKNDALNKSMSKVQSQINSGPSVLSQIAGAAAIEGSKEFLKENNIAYKRRRDLLYNKLNEIEGLDCALPGGAFYIFPSCAKVLVKNLQMVKY